VEVAVDCPPGLSVLGDRDLVEQVLTSLADNAEKHTANGRILLAAHAAGGTAVALEVSDTGPGIPVQEQERIFDRFYRGRRDAAGFGLGLAIARQGARALGGRLEVESAPGEGTTVRVLLASAGEKVA
jgi:signal transduction histidine kinase